ncbi:MAG TPA: exonuclease SbcCD subunit D [Anaerolineae bacterium]|nr:exonuclease SbcCD subunit D [Anaerolineae bacterium]HRU94853.1 exonuclease SbcCD subunit D [Anaerolineae bacterium]
MADPIRILHFADLHIGMENYGRLDPETGLNLRVVDFLRRMDEVVTYAITHEADAVLFAGDAFRTRTPSPTHQREFAQRIRRLSEAAIPTVLLVGNHDIPLMEQRASSVEIFSTLGVPHVTVADRPELVRLETRRGPLQVATVPFPVHQRLLTREQYRRMSREALDQAVSGALVDLMQQLAARADPDIPTVLLGHFSVENAHWGSERNIMVGRDVTLPLSALCDPTWDYVALGHIHQHQDLNPEQAPPVVYPGSLERVDFGEEKQPKGFCWLELRRGQADWRYVELPARRFCTVRVDVRAESEPLAAVRAAVSRRTITDAVVRLVLTLTPEQEPLLRDAALMPLLEGAFFAQINREIDRAVRDRLEGLDPESLTPEHLLKRYLLSKGKSEAELALYLEEARALFEGPEGEADRASGE